MTTLVTARESVYKRLVDNWTSTPYEFQNEATVPPLDAGEVSWIRLSFLEQGLDEQTLGGMGTRKYRRAALISVQIFTPTQSTGMASADTIAEAIRTLYEGVRFDTLETFNADVRAAGTRGKWQLTVVDINTRYTETK